jgi:hypothetical protein
VSEQIFSVSENKVQHNDTHQALLGKWGERERDWEYNGRGELARRTPYACMELPRQSYLITCKKSSDKFNRYSGEVL